MGKYELMPLLGIPIVSLFPGRPATQYMFCSGGGDGTTLLPAAGPMASVEHGGTLIAKRSGLHWSFLNLRKMEIFGGY
jgi:hypothetical protein